MQKHNFILLILVVFLISSCKIYKENILFRTDGDVFNETITEYNNTNYTLQVNDKLDIQLYANNGESLVDPNYYLLNNNNSNSSRSNSGGNSRRGGNSTNSNNSNYPSYLIQGDSLIKLPLIGKINLTNLTIDEAETILEKKYSKYFSNVYSQIRIMNRRVFVLGSFASIIELKNENTNLLEILADAGGVQENARGSNIRILRGDLKNPEIIEISLNKIKDMTAKNLKIYPNDVIYIEPIRRVFYESLKDITPILSITSSLIAFSLVLQNLK